MNRIGFIVSTALVALALLSSMLFVVNQRQFGVLYALGQIKEVITEPGLNFKLPPPFQMTTRFSHSRRSWQMLVVRPCSTRTHADALSS